MLYGEMVRQSTMLAYLDVFACWIPAVGIIPLLFLMKKVVAGKGQAAVH